MRVLSVLAPRFQPFVNSFAQIIFYMPTVCQALFYVHMTPDKNFFPQEAYLLENKCVGEQANFREGML